MRRLPAAILLLSIAFAVIQKGDAAPIKVFAAASLTEAFNDIGKAYARIHPNDPVLFSFAGSPTLRTQIEQGAPVDVFASADMPNMDALVAQRLVARPVVFAENVMVVVTPASSTRVSKIGDLAQSGVRLVLAGPTVPAGRYAGEVLDKMTPSIAPDFAKKALANVVSRETSVKAVLAKVSLGEADAGFVFATDAAAAGDKVRVLRFPPRFNVIGQYPAATVKGASNASGGSSFISYVMSPPGQAILREHGFLTPPKSR